MVIDEMDIPDEKEIVHIRSGVYSAHPFERVPTSEILPWGLPQQMYCYDTVLLHAGLKRFQHDDDKRKRRG